MLIPNDAPDVIRQAIRACRPHYIAAAVLSALGNLLYLTPTLFMLQVYDRVVPTGGLATLALLAGIALLAYATLGAFEWLRGRLLVKASVTLDRSLAEPILTSVMSRESLTRVERAEAMRELDLFRQVMAGPILTIVFDAPWTPIYVIAAFLVNPWLGVLTLVAGAILVGLALSNERLTHAPLEAANDAASASYSRQSALISHSAQVRALGMRRALTSRLLEDRTTSTRLQLRASFAGGGHTTLIKIVRLVLQSTSLGLGAWLAIDQKISAGAIMATSLLMSRALSPIELLTQSWKTVIRARGAFAHLCAVLNTPAQPPLTILPRPQGRIDLEDVCVLAPNSDRVAIAGVSLSIQAGEVIGIAGLSGAGKSTLLAAMAGAFPLLRGSIRIDGAKLETWDAERMADHVGYLPQDFVLFPGTVKENIARFSPDLVRAPEEIDARVVAVAQAVGAHEMIARLPMGYDTPVGHAGLGLSAGQGQRIALARALYGDPAILLLDEPSAHLDSEGQVALLTLLDRLRDRGVTVILTAHHGDLLAATDKVMLLAQGRVARFEPLMRAQEKVHRLEEKRA